MIVLSINGGSRPPTSTGETVGSGGQHGKPTIVVAAGETVRIFAVRAGELVLTDFHLGVCSTFVPIFESQKR